MISNIDSMIKWASGFVDGEGYLQYKQEPYKRIRMEVCNTDFRPIEVLQEIFGGKIYYRKPRVSAKGTITKPQKTWVVLNEECYEACKSLLPFLITSKKIDVAKQIVEHYDKKVRINKAIFGKKVFKSRVELEFYRRYETMKLDKKLVMDVHQAVGRAEGYIPCDTAEEEIEAWQYLIDTGVAWQLQGWFGRQANFMIENKLCKPKVVN